MMGETEIPCLLLKEHAISKKWFLLQDPSGASPEAVQKLTLS